MRTDKAKYLDRGCLPLIQMSVCDGCHGDFTEFRLKLLCHLTEKFFSKKKKRNSHLHSPIGHFSSPKRIKLLPPNHLQPLLLPFRSTQNFLSPSPAGHNYTQSGRLDPVGWSSVESLPRTQNLTRISSKELPTVGFVRSEKLPFQGKARHWVSKSPKLSQKSIFFRFLG